MNKIDADRLEASMKKLLPEGWSWGYIGNVYMDGTDDRSWFIFAPHPGRVGQEGDRIGGFSTEDRHKLLPIAVGIDFGFQKAKGK